MTAAYSFSLPRPQAPVAALPTEAELQAVDRCYALAKDAGVLDRLRDLRALQQQIKESPPNEH